MLVTHKAFATNGKDSNNQCWHIFMYPTTTTRAQFNFKHTCAICCKPGSLT